MYINGIIAVSKKPLTSACLHSQWLIGSFQVHYSTFILIKRTLLSAEYRYQKQKKVVWFKKSSSILKIQYSRWRNESLIHGSWPFARNQQPIIFLCWKLHLNDELDLTLKSENFKQGENKVLIDGNIFTWHMRDLWPSRTQIKYYFFIAVMVL